MPYAAADRQEFIKRSGIDLNARILDFGGTLSGELQPAVFGITTPRRHLAGAVLIDTARLPFKDSAFDATVSYHYFDLIPSDKLGPVFREVARALGKDAVFSFTVLLWSPQNEAQRSSLFFNELLKSTGVLFQHEFEDISGLLEASGFREITVESIKRDVIIPRDYTRSHLLMLGDLIKKEKEAGGTGIKALSRRYFDQANVHGEAMLPAIHFTARKI